MLVDKVAYSPSVSKVFLLPFTGKFPKIAPEISVLIPNAESTLKKYPVSDVYTYNVGSNVFILWRQKKTAKSPSSIDTLNKALDLVEVLGETHSVCVVLGTDDTEVNKYLQLCLGDNPSTVFSFKKDNYDE